MRTLALAVALCSLSACTANSAKPTVSALRLYVIDCGTLTVTDPIRFGLKKEQVKELDLSMGCYLIAHPKGLLIWDTGAVPDTAFKESTPAKKFYATVAKSLTSQIESTGFALTDVNFLALSHYHWDHIGNATLFTKATWLTQKVERDVLFGPLLPERETPDQVLPLANLKTIDLPNADYDVFGDGSVIVKPSFGHTPGHNVLFLKLAKAGPIVLSGDLYHYPEEVTTGIVPFFEFSRDATAESRKQLEAFMQTAGAKLWIQHDLLHFRTLKKAPQFYE